MSRYVILEHDHPSLHWDLMLDTGQALRTWRLGGLPVESSPIAVMAIADHRRMYLDYEGPVSGGRGVVKAWDRGEYGVIRGDLNGDRAEIHLRLSGQRLHGVLVLRPLGGDAWTAEYAPAV